MCQERSAKVLVVDPREERRKWLIEILRDTHELVTVFDPVKALQVIEESRFDLVIVALMVGRTNWKELLKAANKKDATTGVIVIVEKAEDVVVLEEGADGCISSPFTTRVITEVAEVLRKKVPPSPIQFGLPGIVGFGTEMQSLFREIDILSLSENPVLILGEPGTGKTSVARAIHRLSQRGRDKQPFRICRCGGQNSQSIEIEIFGHERGAFPWATEARPGLVEEANGGTVYLDEVGELDQAIQAKMLRLLEEPNLQTLRLGGNSRFSVDVRLITGSAQQLRQKVEQKLFREDLFFRMSQIALPPLRARRDDIPELVHHFLRKLESTSPSEDPTGAAISSGFPVSEKAMVALQDYPWPGNVRELENTIEQVSRRHSSSIEYADLPVHIRRVASRSRC